MLLTKKHKKNSCMRPSPKAVLTLDIHSILRAAAGAYSVSAFNSPMRSLWASRADVELPDARYCREISDLVGKNSVVDRTTVSCSQGQNYSAIFGSDTKHCQCYIRVNLNLKFECENISKRSEVFKVIG